MTFVERIRLAPVPAVHRTNSCVDVPAARAYIDGGPHLPNEVLSFWKE